MKQWWRKCVGAGVAAAALCLLLATLPDIPYLGGSEGGRVRGCALVVVPEFASCIQSALDRTPSDRWHKFPKLVRDCSARTFRLHSYHNKDDVKRVVEPVAAWGKDDVSVLTLGIGGDVGSELAFKKDYPNCKFYGADPTPINGQAFANELGGRYFPTAVGMTNGKETMNILVGPGLFDYAPRKVNTQEFITFLASVKRKRMDHLWLDNEGPEYPMFQRYFVERKLAAAGFSFCQINVEFHGPVLESYNMSSILFDELIGGIVTRSGLLPIYMDDPQNHLRAAFLNFADPHCVQKYVSRVLPNQCL